MIRCMDITVKFLVILAGAFDTLMVVYLMGGLA